MLNSIVEQYDDDDDDAACTTTNMTEHTGIYLNMKISSSTNNFIMKPSALCYD